MAATKQAGTTQGRAAGKTATKSGTAKKAAKRPAAKAASKTAAKSAAKRATKSARAAGNYTDPALRERLKQAIIAGTKGGRAGQWSARKAQLLAHEYEAHGGGYTGAKTDAQQHLDQWTHEAWQTADGRPARRGATTARYLPKKAWKELTPAERRSTDKKKRAAGKRGQQFVANTGPAAAARRDAAEGGAAKRPVAKRAAKGTAKRATPKRTTAKRATTKRAPAKRAAAKRTAR